MGKKLNFKIGPELRVEMNREMERARKYAGSPYCVPINVGELTGPEKVKIALKRAAELKGRGYPDMWIQIDLEKLMGEI